MSLNLIVLLWINKSKPGQWHSSGHSNIKNSFQIWAYGRRLPSYRLKFEALRTRLSHQSPTCAFFSLCFPLLPALPCLRLWRLLIAMPLDSASSWIWTNWIVLPWKEEMWWRRVGGTGGWQSGRPEQEAVGVRHYTTPLKVCEDHWTQTWTVDRIFIYLPPVSL